MGLLSSFKAREETRSVEKNTIVNFSNYKKYNNNHSQQTIYTMGLIKIFSGKEIFALSLQEKIEAIGVNTVIRSNNQANVLPSIQTEKAVELFIQEVDFGKASPVIEEFRLKIDKLNKEFFLKFLQKLPH